jgi:hypothetical protein
MAAISAIAREIIVRRILRLTAPATIVRRTDRATRQVTTGREIVPVATSHINHPDLVHQADRCSHPGRARRIVRVRADLRSLVKRGRRVRISLVLRDLSPSLTVRAVHRRSRESVSNQGPNRDRMKVNTKKGTSGKGSDGLMVSKKNEPGCVELYSINQVRSTEFDPTKPGAITNTDF